MAASSLRIGLVPTEFESLQRIRKFNSLGFSSSAVVRRIKNGVTLVLGRKCWSRVWVQGFSVRSELSVQREAVNVVTPKEVEGASPSDGFMVKDKHGVVQKSRPLEVDKRHCILSST